MRGAEDAAEKATTEAAAGSLARSLSGPLLPLALLLAIALSWIYVCRETLRWIAEVPLAAAERRLQLPHFLGLLVLAIGSGAAFFALHRLRPTAVSDGQLPDSRAGRRVWDCDLRPRISALPLGKIAFFFIFYFLGGYLTYASLFAAIGSVVSDDQNEAQQLVFPVMMPIILAFVIMMKAINDPNSSLAVFGSLFPLTSPIVMMGRITFDVPFWQIALSMALLIGCFLFFTWITGRIYRTGILMYGKKPSWKEMLKWAFRKA